MKNFILPALIVGSLTLFSFTKPVECGVQKIGGNLYSVTGEVSFSQEDQDLLKQSIMKAYKLTDLDFKNATDGNITLKASSGKAWISWHCFELFIINHLNIWDKATISDKDREVANQMAAVVQKYAK